MRANDKSMLGTMAALGLAALGCGAACDGVSLPLVVGGILAGLAAGAALTGGGARLSQIGLPVLGMLMVALVIHVARGRPEAHFAVFALLACTVVYRHGLPVLAAAATTAAHHLGFNPMQQSGWGPVRVTEPGLFRVLEHAAHVVAEAGLLMLLAQRARRDFLAGEEQAQVAQRLQRADGSVDCSAAHLSAAAPVALQGLNALRQVERVLLQMRGSADSIGGAASEIATGNADPSQRTEVAARGGPDVARVVSTMDEINTRSKKPADIIGTIDGIAAPTRILAPNAAVEAARAGEQGRGFAVGAFHLHAANRAA